MALPRCPKDHPTLVLYARRRTTYLAIPYRWCPTCQQVYQSPPSKLRALTTRPQATRAPIATRATPAG